MVWVPDAFSNAFSAPGRRPNLSGLEATGHHAPVAFLYRIQAVPHAGLIANCFAAQRTAH